MPTRNVNLTDELDRFAKKGKAGRYENAASSAKSFGIGSPEAIMDLFANPRNSPGGGKRCRWK
jgi:hypothetical protein